MEGIKVEGEKKELEQVVFQVPPDASPAGPFSIHSSGRPDTNRARQLSDVFGILLRLLCLLTSAVSLSFMVTAKQDSTLSIYGFELPVSSKWSFSDSFVYLVGVSAAVAANSMVLLLITMARLQRKTPIFPSRKLAWTIFAGDQVLAYALLSAGSAAAGVANLNRTGIRHTAFPSFCKPLHSFCDRVAASIVFAFFSCALLASSALLDVLWLSTTAAAAEKIEIHSII